MLLLLLALLSPGVPGAAQEGPAVAVSGGVFDFGEEDEGVELGLEYRHRPWKLRLVPTAGVSATGDESVWLYGGLRRDFSLGGPWLLTPGFAVALYEEGDGKDLGGVVEFRSSLELAVAVGRRSRVGIAVYHLSNAGIYDTNPGSDSAVVTFSVYP